MKGSQSDGSSNSRPLGLQTTLHRIADVRGHVAENGNAVSIARNAIAIVADGEIVFGVLPTPRDRDLSRVRVDAVLDELGNSIERTLLRLRIEANGQDLLTRRDLVTDRQIRLARGRDVVKPGEFFFRCGSTITAAHC